MQKKIVGNLETGYQLCRVCYSMRRINCLKSWCIRFNYHITVKRSWCFPPASSPSIFEFLNFSNWNMKTATLFTFYIDQGCAENQLACPSGPGCLDNVSQVCDGRMHCPYGVDELGCGKYRNWVFLLNTFGCKNTGHSGVVQGICRLRGMHMQFCRDW